MQPSAEHSYSYDIVPYPSKPFAQTHPDRLATIGMLLGMQVQPVNHCRVLEIGCARGDNLLPMAEQLPDSQFVGIDLSHVHIAEAQQTLTRLGFTNIRFHRLDIMDFDSTWGQFDYIICHGVFSWVPPPVQDQILAICSTHLAPQGIAYVSYNTYPGWHMRYMIRDMMCYHTSKYGDPQVRIREARGLLDFLAQHASPESAYGKLMQSEAQALRGHEDSYLFHEHLEDFNQPCYFFQLIERAEAKGLQYLAEADMASMWSRHLPADVAATLERVASDLIQMEQYMDFLRNRTFRQTLLCHQHVKVDRALKPYLLDAFFMASLLTPEVESHDVRSSFPLRFSNRHTGQGMATHDSFIKSAMLYLSEQWPAGVAFSHLVSEAQLRATGEAILGKQELNEKTTQLGTALLEAYLSGLCEIHSIKSSFDINASDFPVASRLGRLQSESTPWVTNLMHESVYLNDLARHVIHCLDGSHSRRDLLKMLTRLVEEKVLVWSTKGGGEDQQPTLVESLDRTLQFLARNALLLK